MEKKIQQVYVNLRYRDGNDHGHTDSTQTQIQGGEGAADDGDDGDDGG